jgi:hypothetical protein
MNEDEPVYYSTISGRTRRFVHATRSCAVGRSTGGVMAESEVMTRELIERGFKEPCGRCGKGIRRKLGLDT